MASHRLFMSAFLFKLVLAAFCIKPTATFCVKHSIRTNFCRRYISLTDSETSPVRPFADHNVLLNLVELAANPLPGAEEGVIVVAKYTDSKREGKLVSEFDKWGDAEVTVDEGYSQLAVEYPSTIFLQCDACFAGGKIAMATAGVTTLPTFDFFFKGNKVGRVSGPQYNEVRGWLTRYSMTSLTGEANPDAPDFVNNRVEPWGEKKNMGRTPRTTARFVPGFDWDSSQGAFDKAGKDAEDKFRAIFGSSEEEENQ